MAKNRARKRAKKEKRAGLSGAQRQELDATLATAVQLHQHGHLEQAETLYKVILKIDPDYPDALHLLGVLAHQAGQNEAACALIGRAIAVNPAVAQYHYNRGVAFQARDDNDAAAESYREAVRLKPDYREAFENLGVALQDMNEINAAGEAYRRAIEINEASPLALHNLGTLLKNIGEIEQADQHFSRGLAINPVYAEARWKKAHALLALGRFSEGWKQYEWRFYADSFLKSNPPRTVPFPKWDGSPLAGKRLLITPEQGIGDEIMFASCFPDAISASESCAIECDPRLVRFFERSFPGAEILAAAPSGCSHYSRTAPFDYYIPAGSLPRFFRSDLESFPIRDRYLQPDEKLRRYWQDELEALGGAVNIGVSWRGGKETRAREARSIDLSRWQKILGVEDANFINLQYGDHSEEIAESGARLHTFERIDPLTDLEDFAALISALDLVISVDNSTVHLAGALGIPVWMLLPRSAEWRWGDTQSSSVWYGSARLFRQGEPGSEAWDTVLTRVYQELRASSSTGALARDPKPILKAGEAHTAPRKAPQITGAGQVLLINDTSSWYHWGCTCTSIAVHEQLRRRWQSVESLPITRTNNLADLPRTVEEFDDDACFARFAAAHEDIVARLRQSDAVYVNGEGTLHGTGTQAISLLYLAYIAKTRFGKTAQIINHSCYPDGTDSMSESPAWNLYRRVYSEIDRVAAREPVSARLLAAMGIEATSSFDCLPLFLEQHYQQRRIDRDKSIVIAGSVAWGRDAALAIGELIKELHAAGFHPKLLMGATACPAVDDLHFVEAVHPAFGDYFTLVNATSESAWLDTIAGASLLISGRFHHTIAAAFLGTPFIVMESNTPKITGLMEMLSLDTMASIRDPDLPATLSSRAQQYVADPGPALLTDTSKERLRELSLQNF